MKKYNKKRAFYEIILFFDIKPFFVSNCSIIITVPLDGRLDLHVSMQVCDILTITWNFMRMI